MNDYDLQYVGGSLMDDFGKKCFLSFRVIKKNSFRLFTDNHYDFNKIHMGSPKKNCLPSFVENGWVISEVKLSEVKCW